MEAQGVQESQIHGRTVSHHIQTEPNSPTPVFPRPLWGEGVIGSPVGASGGSWRGREVDLLHFHTR